MASLTETLALRLPGQPTTFVNSYADIYTQQAKEFSANLKTQGQIGYSNPVSAPQTFAEKQASSGLVYVPGTSVAGKPWIGARWVQSSQPVKSVEPVKMPVESIKQETFISSLPSGAGQNLNVGSTFTEPVTLQKYEVVKGGFTPYEPKSYVDTSTIKPLENAPPTPSFAKGAVPIREYFRGADRIVTFINKKGTETFDYNVRSGQSFGSVSASYLNFKPVAKTDFGPPPTPVGGIFGDLFGGKTAPTSYGLTPVEKEVFIHPVGVKFPTLYSPSISQSIAETFGAGNKATMKDIPFNFKPLIQTDLSKITFPHYETKIPRISNIDYTGTQIEKIQNQITKKETIFGAGFSKQYAEKMQYGPAAKLNLPIFTSFIQGGAGAYASLGDIAVEAIPKELGGKGKADVAAVVFGVGMLSFPLDVAKSAISLDINRLSNLGGGVFAFHGLGLGVKSLYTKIGSPKIKFEAVKAGENTVYRGIIFERSQQAYPIVGQAATMLKEATSQLNSQKVKLSITIGTPKQIIYPEIPSELPTALSGKLYDLFGAKQFGATPGKLLVSKTLQQASRLTLTSNPEPLQKTFEIQAKTLSPKENVFLTNFFKKQAKEGTEFQVYGSAAQKMNLGKIMTRQVKDVDVMYYKLLPERVLSVREEMLFGLQKIGGKGTFRLGEGLLIEKNIPKVGWVHALDIHADSIIDATTISKSPAGELGRGYYSQPSTFLEKVPIMRIGEQGARKVVSISNPSAEFGIGPASHRLKDISDAFVIQEYLVGLKGKTGLLNEIKAMREVAIKEYGLPKEFRQVLYASGSKASSVAFSFSVDRLMAYSGYSVASSKSARALASVYRSISPSLSQSYGVIPSAFPSVSRSISALRSVYSSASLAVSSYPSRSSFSSISVSSSTSPASLISSFFSSPSSSRSPSISPYKSPSISPYPSRSPSISPYKSPSISPYLIKYPNYPPVIQSKSKAFFEGKNLKRAIKGLKSSRKSERTPLADALARTIEELQTGRQAKSPNIKAAQKAFYASAGSFVPTAKQLRGESSKSLKVAKGFSMQFNDGYMAKQFSKMKLRRFY